MDFFTSCSKTRPVTKEELQLLPEMFAIGHEYAEHMTAAAAAEGRHTGSSNSSSNSNKANRGNSSSSSNSRSGGGKGYPMEDVITMQFAVYQTGSRAISRLHTLLCSEVLGGWEYEVVVDALRGPAGTAELTANLAVCCEYLCKQCQQLEQQQREQGQQKPQQGAGRGGKPQATTSGAASFRELAFAPAHELVWMPGGELGKGTRLETYVSMWENAEGTHGTQGAVATVSSLINILSTAAEEEKPDNALATAIHGLLLLEALVLVGCQREQQGLPVDEKFLNGTVLPIAILLKNSLEDAKRDERETLVIARGSVLLSVLQLLLRKVDAAGGGDGSGVGGMDASAQKRKLRSQRTMLKLVLETLTEAVDLNGLSKYVCNMDDDDDDDGSDGSSCSSSNIGSSEGSSSSAGLKCSRGIGDGSSSGSSIGEGRGCKYAGGGGGGGGGSSRGTLGSGGEDEDDWESSSSEDNFPAG